MRSHANFTRAHEEIRVLSHQAGSVVKIEVRQMFFVDICDFLANDILPQGKPNDLVSRIRNAEFFKPIWGELDTMLDPRLYEAFIPLKQLCSSDTQTA